MTELTHYINGAHVKGTSGGFADARDDDMTVCGHDQIGGLGDGIIEACFKL